MLLQVMEAGTAMVAQAMLVVRATVEITMAAADRRWKRRR